MDIVKDVAVTSRIERKFYLPPGRVDLAYAVLRQVCRTDPDYPEGRVNSLYFDTLDLDSYSASESGDWERHKVRLRWYGDIDALAASTVFLELKSKRGQSTTKQRRSFIVPAERLHAGRLHKGAIGRRALVDTLTGMGQHDGPRLRPIVVISYRRKRLVDLLSGVRVSLDSEITSTLISKEIGMASFHIRLPGDVLEIKGPYGDLPQSLRRIGLLGTGWSRYSKYCQCLGAHLFETDSVGGRWPSGMWTGT